MKRLVSLTALVFCGCVARVTPVQPAPAPPPPSAQSAPAPAAKHPAYLHALADLRLARAFLERPANVVVKWDERRAIVEIDGAIHRIREAAIDDGKDVADHPPVDRPTWGGRLDRALQLLDKARADIAEEEDSPSSAVHRYRQLALEHIGNADRMVRDGISDARALHETAQPPPPPAPAQHPAYLHALSDLRLARALLERPVHDADVKWDENRAIGRVDAAIREIKQASIDDDKPLSDHPPVDAHVRHRDRLRQAAELLAKAARDIEEREDNGYASGLRARAIEHIRGAERAIRDAIQDRRR
jgi:tetratricopeptide (TPR) repeat protein